MNKYQVIRVYSNYCTFDVEAESPEEALKIINSNETDLEENIKHEEFTYEGDKVFLNHSEVLSTNF